MLVQVQTGGRKALGVLRSSKRVFFYTDQVALRPGGRLEGRDRREQHGRVVIEDGSKVVGLLNAHGERLYRLMVRFTLREDVAEDLLQDLAVKLSQASSFAAAADPYAYARKAAVNLAFSWIRRCRRAREQAVEGIEQPADDPPVWANLVAVENIRQVLDHMEAMSERDRLILAMRYFDGADYNEIARVIGGTGHQARGLCHKAIRQLRAAMAETEFRAVQPRTEVKP